MGPRLKTRFLLTILVGIGFWFTFGVKNRLAAPQAEETLAPLPLNHLQVGDVVLTGGIHWRSQAVSLLNPGSDYTHIGIVAENSEGLVIVHADPESPEDGSKSKVVSQPAASFFSNPKLRTVRVIRLAGKGGDPAVAAEVALEMAQQKTPFDQNFDLDSPDSVYCSELVWRAFRTGGVDLLKGVHWQEHIILVPHPLLLPSTFSEHPQFNLVLDHPSL